MNFADLKDKHLDCDFEIFGTGKSLERYDTSENDDVIRIVLNRAIGAVELTKGKAYWLALDYLWDGRYSIPDEWLEGCLTDSFPIGLFPHKMYGGKTNIMHDSPKCEGVVNYKINDKHLILNNSKDHMATSEEVYAFTGTAAPAVHLAWYMGARTITLVGIDGNDGYSDDLLKYYDNDKKGGFGYFMAKKDAINTAIELKVKCFDYSESKVIY